MASELAKILADFRTQLTAKISVGGTSGAIQTNTDDDGVTIPNGTYYFTIDGDNSQKEYIQCTLTGLNMTAINSVSRQGTITSGTVREHRVGAIVTVTDFGIIKKMLDILDGTTDLDATNPLKYDADPTITDDKELATKKYADDLAIAGSPKATDSVYGLVKLSTPAVDPLQPKAVGDNDPRVPTQDENNAQAGTSGTPSTTNKYVTENDTSNFASKTASTISFVAGTKTIADSGSGFVTAGFRAGSSIAITGSASNNGTFTIVSVLAGAIVVAETLTDESASATVTMTAVTANKVMRLKSNGKIDATQLDGKLPALDGSDLTGVLASNLDKYTGIGDATLNKTRWNYQIPFSSFTHTNAVMTSQGFYATRTVATATGISYATLYNGQCIPLRFVTKNFSIELFLKLSSVGSNIVKFGFNSNVGGFYGAYNETTYDCADFVVNSDGKLYSHVANGTNGTNTEITGIALTNWNRFRIEVDAAGECRFYINGVLKDTRTTNVPNNGSAYFGIGNSGAATNLVDTLSIPEFSVAI